MNPIVLDNSVLSAFSKIQRLNLLKEILSNSKVYVPTQVYREIIFEDVLDVMSFEKKENDKWIVVENVDISGVDYGLGAGETGVIKLALEKGAIVVLDDLHARKVAERLGLRFTGTLGLLKVAYEKRIIDKNDLDKILRDLVTKDKFRINTELEKSLLKKKKETQR